MSGMSPVHWIIVLAIIAIPLPPLIKILRRTGHSGWWSVLYFLPVLNWIGLYVLANARWPGADSKN